MIVSESAGTSKPSGVGGLLDGLHVLVVEDETLVFFLIEDMLRSLGCADVRHANAVQEAMAMMKDSQPDLAILDVNLGGDTVYPLAMHLETAGIPFIFATGYGRSGLPERWLKQPVVQKPFGPDVFSAAVRAALAGRRSSD